MNNDPDNCSDGLQTFSQHSGECWNDAVSNLLFFTPRLAPLVRAKTAADFQAWVANPPITAWLHERFQFKNARQLELFVYYASQYVSCLKERFENWKQRRVTVNATRRRRSCVFSKCSAASGMIASAILRLQRNPEINSINANFVKALKNNALPVNMVAQIERGLSMEMVNYAQNFKIMEKKGYNIGEFSDFINVLLYFYYGFEVVVPLDSDPSVERIFAIGGSFMNMEKVFLKIRKYQPTHHINLVLTVSLPFVKIYHAIHLLTCANNKQYVYDNNTKTIISSKWLSYFMTPYDNAVTTFYMHGSTNYKKYNLLFELLLRYVVYLNFEIRTYEQIEQIMSRTMKTSDDPRKKQQYEFFFNLVFKNIGIHPDCMDFLTHGLEFDPTQKKAGIIHQKIESDVAELVSDSLFFQLYETHKPTFFVLTETHLYLICKENVKKVSIAQLGEDHLWNISVFLLKTPKNAILFLCNMYDTNLIYAVDTVDPFGIVMFTPK